jgi:branched-chain amino acid transport system substrate-binding protein
MKRMFVWVAFLSLLLLPAIGQSEVGVTANEIRIGFYAPMTGFASYFGPSLRNGLSMVFDDVNNAGGIHGRKLKIVMEDDACDATKAVAASKKLIVRDKVFAIFGGPCAHSVVAVCNLAETEKLPFLMMSSAEEVVKTYHKYCFIVGMTTWTQSRLMVDFAINELKAKRIGVVYQTGAYGQPGGEGFITRMKKYGMEPVAAVAHKIGDTDYTAQVLKLKEANADVVLVFSYTKEGAMIVRQAWEKGLKAQWVMSTTGNIPSVIDLATKEAVSGRYYAINLTSDILEGSKLKPFLDIYGKKFPTDAARPDFPNDRDTISYLGGKMIVEALKKCGPDLTRQKFIGALESLNDFRSEFFPPVSFKPNDHDASKITYWMMYDENGKRRFIDKLYEWTEPFSGSAGPGETPEALRAKEEEYYRSLKKK